jgi:hypothetical protein
MYSAAVPRRPSESDRSEVIRGYIVATLVAYTAACVENLQAFHAQSVAATCLDQDH